MSNAALIEIGDDVTSQLANFKSDESKRAIQLTIENEVLQVVRTVPATSSMENDFDGLQDILEQSKPSYIIIHLKKDPDYPEFVLIVFIPPKCPIRPRTIFASSRSTVQRYLNQIFVNLGDYFVDNIAEVTFKAFLHVTTKDEASMTIDEIQQKKEAQENTVSQVSLPTHDTFTWPVADDLLDLLRQFASGSGPTVVAGMASNTGGAISTAGTGNSLSDIDNSAPRYIAINYDNKGEKLKVFVLYCPDNAKSREKMMSSTCKHSFIKGCSEVGLEFDKFFEIRDERDFNDSNLDLLINPVHETHGYGEIKVHRKPRAPGRK
ncbi:actin depolymerizing protein [Histomonas meleagridis]|uniref:actin depolymerizing protein n=1 Tax=Histomonas meleagridis TaxID=135588 RepID=UPI00355A060E|nr:actin depolymerizing protein [Histomonas meleagridis]KAH0803847.1 actin depolymerizing protein [Histomonas meleagridis]